MKFILKTNHIKTLRKMLDLNYDDFGGACNLMGKHRGRTVSRWERGLLAPSAAAITTIKSMIESLCKSDPALWEKFR